MNENTKSNRISQHFNSRTVKSTPPKVEYHEVRGFAGQNSTTKSILPREDSFDIAKWLKDFDKKTDKFFEKLCTSCYDAAQEISRGIRGLVRAYLRLLMLCAIIAIGYFFLVYMVEENPSIIATIPNITKLMQSMQVLAGYTTDFLNWNFVCATRIIEQIISEVNALIS